MTTLAAISTKSAPASMTRRISSVFMTFKEWEKLPTFLSQRDTASRAMKKVNIEKFMNPLPTHFDVAAVCLRDGRMFKVDGHTRTVIWQAIGMIPKEVHVRIYYCDSFDQARAIYDSIDERKSAKDSADTIYSAMRECNFTPISPLVSSCKFGEALNLSFRAPCRGYSKAQQVKDAISTLKILDQLLPTKEDFPTPITAAALLSIKRDGSAALRFWRAFTSGAADFSGNAHDLLTGYIKEAVWGKRAANLNTAGRCLAIYEAWSANPDVVLDSFYPFSLDGETVIAAFKKTM